MEVDVAQQLLTHSEAEAIGWSLRSELVARGMANAAGLSDAELAWADIIQWVMLRARAVQQEREG